MVPKNLHRRQKISTKKNRQKIVTYNVTTTDDIARFVI